METIRYISSLLTFYNKGEIGLDHNMLRLKTPYFPAGSKTESIPVEHIASVTTDFTVNVVSVLVGILAIIVSLYLSSLYLIEEASTVFFVVLIGILLILSGLNNKLSLTLTSGKVIAITFSMFDQSKAKEASYGINGLISRRYDATNVGLHK